MKPLSYKFKLLAIYIAALLLILVLIYNLLSSFQLTNIGTISQENFKNKALEREAYVNEYFYTYKTTLQAMQESEIIKQYLSKELPQKTVENYFLDIKKSLPCLTQVRFIDINGIEKIRIEGKPIGLFQENATSKIIPKNKLQDKSTSDYVQDFLLLQKKQLAFSKLDLNKEYGKITFPKQPTLRIGVTAYDNLDNKKGILVFNICLRTFFKLLNKTTLYHVHLIDNDGKYINHHNPQYGLLGVEHTYSVFEQFPQDATKILTKDEYFGEDFYSLKLKDFDTGQNLRILLELKYTQALEKTDKTKKDFILFIIAFALVFFLITIYFAKLPDILKDKAERGKLRSKLTNLPNRLALMEALSKKKFSDSLVVLISTNNILKIQNTYGYNISNNLVKQFAYYLKEYGNGIEEVYVNSYNVFGLKYRYKDKETLEKFLKNLIYAIEHYPFAIDIEGNSVEFAIETTFGVSNPDIINNTIDELNEAENALEYALDNKIQIKIFTDLFHENIQENKENLLLAKKIKKAIDNDGIFLHFQPIYNNLTEKIEKYESLIRMRYKNELIFPDRFLPISKQINKYSTLSYIVIDKAFQFFKDKEYSFSINISILDIENPEFREYLFEKLRYYKISDKLVLEIVEQEGVENYEQFFEFIKKIKEHGCKIAIDDFGSGYSNFEHIINSSEYIDYLKIDGSLIKNLPTNPKTQILIGSLKFLCDNLEIETIAEYVEDEEVLKYVQSIGIDYSQGYHIGKPQEGLCK